MIVGSLGLKAVLVQQQGHKPTHAKLESKVSRNGMRLVCIVVDAKRANSGVVGAGYLAVTACAVHRVLMGAPTEEGHLAKAMAYCRGPGGICAGVAATTVATERTAAAALAASTSATLEPSEWGPW